MNKFISNVVASTSSCASLVKNRVIKTVKNPRFTMMVALLFVFTLGIMADTAATGGYEAGKTALSSVTEEIGKYIPLVVKLCYAIAGVVAVLGAISVYMAMNNEEQDVKNILVLQNTFEKTRKQMKVNTLSINALSDNLNFPMFAKLILKKT